MQVTDLPYIFWCRCCGGISTKQTKLLLGECKGRASKWGTYVISQMAAGYHPKVATQPQKLWLGLSQDVTKGGTTTVSPPVQGLAVPGIGGELNAELTGLLPGSGLPVLPEPVVALASTG